MTGVIAMLSFCHCGGPGPVLLPLQAGWSAEGEAVGDSFGIRAMAAGDVNADGFGDLLVGAPHWDKGRGKIYLYLGSAQGLARTPAWTFQGESMDERLGDRVGQAGDVNGDGLGDVFAAAPGWHGGLGRCVVFYGSKRGLGERPDWAVSPKSGGQMFGDCTHPTGDVNGDGFDDLAVGAYAFEASRGRALLYLGSRQGLERQPAWESQGEAAGDWYGYGVAAAGDVNGDAYDDLLTGAKYNDAAGADAGKAYLFTGSKRGLPAQATWTHGGSKAAANASVRVSTAGDVNGDGFADVLVSSPGGDDGGEVEIFLGGPQGLAIEPARRLRGGPWRLDAFGQGACPAGDVDGDGYGDVAIHGRDAHGGGHALVFRGSADGLSAEPTWKIDGESKGDRFGWWLAPAGDVDGDGLADLVVSAESRGPGKVYLVSGGRLRAAGPYQGPIKPARTQGYLRK